MRNLFFGNAAEKRFSIIGHIFSIEKTKQHSVTVESFIQTVVHWCLFSFYFSLQKFFFPFIPSTNRTHIRALIRTFFFIFTRTPTSSIIYLFIIYFEFTLMFCVYFANSAWLPAAHHDIEIFYVSFFFFCQGNRERLTVCWRKKRKGRRHSTAMTLFFPGKFAFFKRYR